MEGDYNMQAFNPFLPSNEYIPDGEPHVFEDRVYLFGSHDQFNGEGFCLNDYICYSANINNLADWKYEGVIYKKTQDPRNVDGNYPMFAPEVAKGADGKYYLYYCLYNLSAVAVAVCDKPAGSYEYLGLVHYEDGISLGEKHGDYLAFDPGVLVDEDSRVWLYLGCGPRKPDDVEPKASYVVELNKDMVTIKTEPKELIPIITNSRGTGFEGHEFFEASSIRKINGRYYFIYSSILSHELCYATSEKPDGNFTYGGTLVSIGDIGYKGKEQKEAINYFGNTHGSIENINGNWYVFYHRHTNQNMYSRQACSEKIEILPDGSIPQVEITSCGLNNGPMIGKGCYKASIASTLRSGQGTYYSHPMALQGKHPYFTQDVEDLEPLDFEDKDFSKCQYIKNIKSGTVIGFKYFDIKSLEHIAITIRGCATGIFEVMTSLDENILGEIQLSNETDEWSVFRGEVNIPDGIKGLYFRFKGEGTLDFLQFEVL
jgi:hypothetical protein